MQKSTCLAPENNRRKNGDRLSTVPAGRGELEHDTMARYLLAQVFDVDMPLSAPFVTTEI
ncbi:hypothetical protein [Streptomyces triticisoli]|jgi:hypothetical protein|uniref:hypothetical protein n=1 Tax=Streptomyces triticisoli TaxID=2182797 RepID=UPI000DD81743|nr:hypothetical protein [Streptomyces triticisoli]